jgi:hypothetical protein
MKCLELYILDHMGCFLYKHCYRPMSDLDSSKDTGCCRGMYPIDKLRMLQLTERDIPDNWKPLQSIHCSRK